MKCWGFSGEVPEVGRAVLWPTKAGGTNTSSGGRGGHFGGEHWGTLDGHGSVRPCFHFPTSSLSTVGCTAAPARGRGSCGDGVVGGMEAPSLP
jgi:hypothetical protein